MSTVFDPTRLVAAWAAHDRWALSLTPEEGSRRRSYLPSNGGVEVTQRMNDAVAAAADAVGVAPSTLFSLIQAERRADPGPDVAGAVARVLDGLTLTVTACSDCGLEMPDYAIYREFHAEHCPNIGPQRAEPVSVEIVDVVEGLL